MKIILTSRVSGLGTVGDVVDVKNGYAKNFLIPEQKAICYSENNKTLFESKKSEYEKASNDALDLANHAKKEFLGKNLVIIENASDDGRLYGSVSSTLIASKINEQLKKEVAKKTDIILAKPIKEIGVYDVKVEIHCDVDCSIKLVVCRLESEVENLIKAHEKAKKQAVQKEKEEKEAATKKAESPKDEAPVEEAPATEEKAA